MHASMNLPTLVMLFYMAYLCIDIRLMFMLIFDVWLGVYLSYASLSHQTRLWEWSTYSGVLASRQTAAPPSDSDRAVTPGPRESTRQLSPARGAEIRHRPGRVSSWLPVESYSSPMGLTRRGIQYRSHTLRGDLHCVRGAIGCENPLSRHPGPTRATVGGCIEVSRHVWHSLPVHRFLQFQFQYSLLSLIFQWYI